MDRARLSTAFSPIRVLKAEVTYATSSNLVLRRAGTPAPTCTCSWVAASCPTLTLPASAVLASSVLWPATSRWADVSVRSYGRSGRASAQESAAEVPSLSGPGTVQAGKRDAPQNVRLPPGKAFWACPGAADLTAPAT